jgi:DinB family protein
MNRVQLLKRLGDAWAAFTSSYADLSGLQMLEPGVTGKWSVRDILAHVTTWEEEALKHLPLILEGGTPSRYSITYGGIDAFNALQTERKKSLSLFEVRLQQSEIHNRLIDFIETVPEGQLINETPFRHRLRLDTYGHYPKHSEPIRKWREQHGWQIRSRLPGLPAKQRVFYFFCDRSRNILTVAGPPCGT